MRVALNASFWDQPHTGSGQYVRNLVRALQSIAPELELLLIAPGWAHTGHRSTQNRTEENSSKLSCVFPCASVANIQKVWFEQVTFPQRARQAGAHLAHVPYFAPPLLPSLPTVVTIHDVIPLILPAYRGSPAVRLYMALVAAGARRAHAVIADSECSKRDIVRVLGVPPDRVEVIHLAADESFAPVTDPAQMDAVRRRYNLPSAYILYLGGFDQRKNLATLMRAYAIARAGEPQPPPLVVAGRLPARDSAFSPDPRRLTREAGLSDDHVPSIGWVDDADKPALYSGATAFVFPSQYEGFGLPPLEAMACGTPVICSDAASLPEVVGEAGILVHPHDVAGLAEAISRVTSDPALRAELSARARRQAARFTWEQTARATLEVYWRLASSLLTPR